MTTTRHRERLRERLDDPKPKAAPNRLRLTDTVVEKLTPTDRPKLYWDLKQPKLALMVYPTGRRAWKLIYRKEHSDQVRWFTIDPGISVNDARKQAQKLLGKIASGHDVQAEKMANRKAGTFAQLAEAYFDHAVSAHKSADQYRGHYQRHLKRLGNRKAESLTTGDFVDVKNALVKAGKAGSVGPVLATASAILGWGINEHRTTLASNPVRGVKGPKLAKSGRALSHDEIRTLWSKLDEAGLIWGSVLRLMLLTGQRSDEIRNMRWEDIEDDGWWTQPTNKADRIHRVYLTATAQAILDDVGRETEGLVFPNRKGQAYEAVPSSVAKRLRKAAGIADFKPHMLRHTVETEMSRLGIAEEDRRKVMNHAEGGMTATYGHYDFDKEKRSALARLEPHLLAIIEGRPMEDNVVKLQA